MAMLRSTYVFAYFGIVYTNLSMFPLGRRYPVQDPLVSPPEILVTRFADIFRPTRFTG